MVWLFVPGLAASNSDSGLPWDGDIELSVTSSGKPTPRRSSWRGWKTRSWIKHLSGTISQPSMASRGVEAWIASLQASPASRSPSPGNVRLKSIPAGSGRTSPELLGKWDRESSSWKMFPVSGKSSMKSSAGWPISGSLRNGTAFRRPKRARVTFERGSSSWPTATASDDNKTPEAHLRMKVRLHNNVPRSTGNYAVTSLKVAVQLWPTPRSSEGDQGGPNGTDSSGSPSLTNVASKQWALPTVRDWKDGAEPSLLAPTNGLLGRQATRWATPQVHDAQGAKTPEQIKTMRAKGAGVRNLNEDAVLLLPLMPCPCGQECRRTLNPRFVEWLQGWPFGMTEFGSLATALFPLWLRVHSSHLRSGWWLPR